MKKLLLLLLLVPTLSFSQVPNQDVEQTAKMYNAGNLLIKGGQRFYLGAGIMFLGSSVATWGSLKLDSQLIYGGAGLMLIGGVVSFTAWIPVIKAGKILKGSSAYISPDGVTLAYSF